MRTQSFNLEESLTGLVADYLAGESACLVEALPEVCSQVSMRTPFEQNLMLGDLVCIEEFFDCGPVKVSRLRKQAKVIPTWVEPEALIDFLATDHERGFSR